MTKVIKNIRATYLTYSWSTDVPSIRILDPAQSQQTFHNPSNARNTPGYRLFVLFLCKAIV
ncbi:hypothetical protein HanRHA438_Chr17g0824891 [Helianthus annuus]|nr:hypothetical protein HanRHA438_Chr17g0824891 [Helianthus annuus]